MFDKFILSASNDLTFWEKIAEWYQNSFLRELLIFIQDRYFTVNFGSYQNFTIGKTTAETIRLLIPALAIAIVVACMMTARVRVNQGRFVRRLLKNECLSPDKAKTLLELDMFRNAAIRRELSRGGNLRMVVRCRHSDGRDTGVGVYLDRSAEELAELFEKDADEGESRSAKKEREDRKAKAADGEEKAEKTSRETAAACADAATENAQKVDGLDAKKNDVERKEEQEMRKINRSALPKIDFTTARFYIPEALKHRADVRFDSRGSSWAPAIASIVLVIFMTSIVCWLLPHVLSLADAIISLAAPSN
ncbi:MAG: hypothetical protein IJW49_08155 [Clostridia bacterium]|nr:hypothetical protein [Clostridia bacterium]